MLKYIELDENNFIIGLFENKQFKGQTQADIPEDFIMGIFQYLNGKIIKNEEAEIKLQKELNNQKIYEKLNELDLKSIRALRVNETEKIEELEAQAVALRQQLQ